MPYNNRRYYQIYLNRTYAKRRTTRVLHFCNALVANKNWSHFILPAQGRTSSFCESPIKFRFSLLLPHPHPHPHPLLVVYQYQFPQ